MITQANASLIKQSTLNNIKDSLVIMVVFDKYGSHTGAKTKISFTYHTIEHAYTVTAWASITFNRQVKLRGYDTLINTLKPSDYSLVRSDKVTGEDTTHSSEDVAKVVFNAVCEELANRTDAVDVGQYLTYRKVRD